MMVLNLIWFTLFASNSILLGFLGNVEHHEDKHDSHHNIWVKVSIGLTVAMILFLLAYVLIWILYPDLMDVPSEVIGTFLFIYFALALVIGALGVWIIVEYFEQKELKTTLLIYSTIVAIVNICTVVFFIYLFSKHILAKHPSFIMQRYKMVPVKQQQQIQLQQWDFLQPLKKPHAN